MTNGSPHPYQPGQQQGQGTHAPSEGAPGTRRSRGRSFLAVGFAVWALLEIWLLILVGEAAGGLTVLAVLIAGFVVGGVVIKRAGRRAWENLAQTMQQAQQAGTPPVSSTDRGRGGNALAMLGGLLLMVPGLLSDVAGLLCIFPPTAGLLRRGTERVLNRGEFGEALRQARNVSDQAHMRRPDGKVVQGEVIRDEEPPSQPSH